MNLETLDRKLKAQTGSPVIRSLVYDLVRGHTVRPVRDRKFSRDDRRTELRLMLLNLGLDYEEGNDAKRGGLGGTWYRLGRRGLRITADARRDLAETEDRQAEVDFRPPGFDDSAFVDRVTALAQWVKSGCRMPVRDGGTIHSAKAASGLSWRYFRDACKKQHKDEQ